MQITRREKEYKEIVIQCTDEEKKIKNSVDIYTKETHSGRLTRDSVAQQQTN